MFGGDSGVNASAYVEIGGQADVARIECFHEVVKDFVGQIFVESAFIAIAPQVDFP